MYCSRQDSSSSVLGSGSSSSSSSVRNLSSISARHLDWVLLKTLLFLVAFALFSLSSVNGKICLQPSKSPKGERDETNFGDTETRV